MDKSLNALALASVVYAGIWKELFRRMNSSQRLNSFQNISLTTCTNLDDNRGGYVWNLMDVPSSFPRRRNYFPLSQKLYGLRDMLRLCKILLKIRQKSCSRPKMSKESSEFTKKRLPIGVWKVSARHIRALAGASFMNAPCWKNILHPGVSKLRTQNDGFLRPPAYPL